MTLTQLEYIIAVDKERNFRKAATACHITQPTLSTQIQKLEEELNIQIFDRKTSPVVPTPIGIQVIEQAKMAINEYRKIFEIVDLEKNQIRGELKIGVIPTIAPYLVPKFLPNFHSKYPDVQISIHELTTESCLKALDANSIDVAILATKESRQIYSQTQLYNEELLLYTNKDELPQIRGPINSKSLQVQKIWLLEQGHCLRDEIIKVSKLEKDLSNSKPEIELNVGSLEMLTRLVDTNGGYTVIPQLMALGLSGNKNIKEFENHPVRKINLTQKKNHWKQRLLQILKDEIIWNLPNELKK